MDHVPLRYGWATVPALLAMGVISSITAAIASVAWTNLRSARAVMGITTAQSAAETGLSFGAARLQSESARYVIDRGVIDEGLAERLWLGTWTSDDGQIAVLDPDGYVIASPSGNGMVHAIFDAHDQADEHAIELEASDASLPALSNNSSRLDVKPIPLGPETDAAVFRLAYEFVLGTTRVRVQSTGIAGGVERTISMEYDIDKRIDYAIVAMSRIMIGSNVLVAGPIGTRYGITAGELEGDHADPIVMRSDFVDLGVGGLDVQLADLQAAIASSDVDGDNRLRPGHPTEGPAVAGSFTDYDGDQYITEMDLFLSHFDANGDASVVYDAAQAAEAGHGGLSQEFVEDMQLALLIDHARPDRNGDGLIDDTDRQLGWDDGMLDLADRYAKVDGSLALAVGVADWESQLGASWQSIVSGPLDPEFGEAASRFGVPETELAELTTDMFAGAQSWFESEASGGMPFGDESTGQVASGILGGGTFTPAGGGGWEDMPWQSSGAYDWFERPIYRDMAFNNVSIPAGTNAVFENCTFVGVTWIETEESVSDPNWNFAGSRNSDGTLQYPGLVAETGGVEVSDTRSMSNNLRFHDCTFLGSIAGDVPDQYTHWRNKVQVTGQSRFFIDPEDVDLAQQEDGAALAVVLSEMDPAVREQLSRSSLLLPGWSVDVGAFTNDEAIGVKLNGTIVAGLLDLRGVVDVHGTILATFRPVEGEGPLFYGGDTDDFNTTIGYFGPEDGDGEGENSSGQSFEGFGRISLRANPDAALPDGVPWPVSVVATAGSYVEGSSE